MWWWAVCVCVCVCMEYYLSIKKNEIAILSNINRSRDCHTKCSNSDREEEISYDIPYMWNLKGNDANECIYKKERHSQRKRQI